MASITSFLLFCTLFQLLIATDTPPCVFPFVYRGRVFTSCTSFNSSKLWCATKANFEMYREWKYCTATEAPPCVFPFTYRGKVFYSCTSHDSWNGLWCATNANYDMYRQWKYCTITVIEE